MEKRKCFRNSHALKWWLLLKHPPERTAAKKMKEQIFQLSMFCELAGKQL